MDHGHAAGAEESEHADAHLPDHTDDAGVHDAHGAHAHDGHASHGRPLPFAPHDSPWKITVPLIVLAVLAVGSGYLNAPALKIYWFEHQTESSIGLPIAHGDEHGGEEPEEEAAGAVTELAAGVDGAFVAAAEGGKEYEAPGEFAVPPPPTFYWSNAAPGLILIGLGIVVSGLASLAVFGRRKNVFSPFVGLTTRSRPIGAFHSFLVNKLYLDHLYEKVIVRAVAYPISQAAYWFNQHVIDGIVNGTGRAGRRSGEFVYRYIDQGIVDGIVNTSGRAASEGGHALQPVQSGKVNQYGALLFAAATVGAILLILLNV